MSYSNLKLAVGFVAAMAGVSVADDALARCVSDMGNGYTAGQIADLTRQAHSSRRNPGNWDPDNRWPFGNGPLEQVRVGRFDFHNAVEKCEAQHVRTGSTHTGLTCGGQVYVITGRERGLQCDR